MAFLIHSIDHGDVAVWEYIPCGAITPKLGMALSQTGGNLAVATGTTAPSYISMCEREGACAAGELIPVIRADEGIIFETTASAALTGVKAGDKVTLHASNGLEVTGTKDGGVAKIVSMEGTAPGSKVLVRFC